MSAAKTTKKAPMKARVATAQMAAGGAAPDVEPEADTHVEKQRKAPRPTGGGDTAAAAKAGIF